MAWIILLAAGLLEIVWAISLKYSNGFTRLTPSIITIIATAASFMLLANAMKVLPAGTAYAVWTGIGAIGVSIIGILVFKEPVNAVRIISFILLIAGIIGLKFSSGV